MREGIGPLPQILNTPMRFSVHNLLNTERHYCADEISLEFTLFYIVNRN